MSDSMDDDLNAPGDDALYWAGAELLAKMTAALTGVSNERAQDEIRANFEADALDLIRDHVMQCDIDDTYKRLEAKGALE
ncbi:hypothetical protein [Streptomyces sp. cg35]|uniref:hypothetical protein n=1 Tax=Streptomyces sp. cg35 TaxID=3421650 RepID=UPI003D169423